MAFDFEEFINTCKIKKKATQKQQEIYIAKKSETTKKVWEILCYAQHPFPIHYLQINIHSVDRQKGFNFFGPFNKTQ